MISNNAFCNWKCLNPHLFSENFNSNETDWFTLQFFDCFTNFIARIIYVYSKSNRTPSNFHHTTYAVSLLLFLVWHFTFVLFYLCVLLLYIQLISSQRCTLKWQCEKKITFALLWSRFCVNAQKNSLLYYWNRKIYCQLQWPGVRLEQTMRI